MFLNNTEKNMFYYYRSNHKQNKTRKRDDKCDDLMKMGTKKMTVNVRERREWRSRGRLRRIR